VFNFQLVLLSAVLCCSVCCSKHFARESRSYVFELQALKSERAPEPRRAARLALPLYENLRLVSKERHVLKIEMSLTEIIEQLPKLTLEERQAIYRRIEMLDGEETAKVTTSLLMSQSESMIKSLLAYAATSQAECRKEQAKREN